MQRDRHVAIWLRMLAEKEISAARSANNLLKAQGNKIKTAYQEGGQMAAFRAVAQGEEQWVRIFVAVYSLTIRTFREYILEQLGAKKSKSKFLDRATQWVSSQAYLKSRYVSATSHEIVKGVITHGLENGLPEREIANNLQDNFVGEVAANRARTIARTEVHNAASYGMQNGAEESGLALEREWVAVMDSRTREDHADADGQIRGMEEPFDIGGEDIDFPGDGSPENSINCRCTIAYNQPDTSFSDTGEDGGDFSSDDSSGDFEE